MRVILPVSAGSGVDAIVRAAGNSLSKALGQPVVVENLPGAGGITGTATLVKAPADGTTIAVVSNNHVTNPGRPRSSFADHSNHRRHAGAAVVGHVESGS